METKRPLLYLPLAATSFPQPLPRQGMETLEKIAEAFSKTFPKPLPRKGMETNPGNRSSAENNGGGNLQLGI
jgi:hypothetical protein